MTRLAGWFGRGKQGAASIPPLIALFLGTILLAFPLLCLELGLERFLAGQIEEVRQEKLLAMEQYMMNLKRETVLRTAIHTFAAQAYLQAERSKHPERALFEAFQPLKQMFPGCLELVIFDAHQRLIPEWSDPVADVALHNECAAALEAFRQGNPRPFNQGFSRFQGILGSLSKSNFLANDKGAFKWDQRVSHLGRRAFAYTLPRYWKPRFILWISIPESVEQLFVEALVQVNGRFGGDSVQAYFDVRRDLPTQEKQFGPAAPFFREALLRLGDNEEDGVTSGGYLWAQIACGKYRRLILCVPDEAARMLQRSLGRLRLATAFLGVATLGFLFGPGRRLLALSLAGRLLLLFVYASAVPLILLGFTGQELMRERVLALEGKMKLEHEEIFGQIEAQHLDYLSWLEGNIQRVSRIRIPPGADGIRHAFFLMQRIARVVPSGTVAMFDDLGRTLFSGFHGDVQELFRKMLPIIGKRLARDLAELNQEDKGLGGTAQEDFLKATLESLGVDLEAFVGLVKVARGALVPFKMGRTQYSRIGFPTISRTDGKICLTTVFAWDDTPLIRTFVPRCLKRLGRKWPRKRFYCDGFGANWKGYPLNFPFRVHAEDMYHYLVLQPVPVHQSLEWSGARWILSGARSGINPMTCFFVGESTELIHREIRLLFGKMWGIGFALLVLGMSMAGFIIRHFLVPIRQLGEGLEAMKERRFTHRLPVGSEDELGHLADHFNQLMEGMADLEVARIVQDTFFPSGPLSGSGWQVFGSSVSASRVGGDYFDYFPLADGRWLILIGDVTGHGVSAALVVAMAKALVCHPANAASAQGVLGMMNTVLARTLAGQKLMTCLLLLFEPKTGDLAVANAGHAYPLVADSHRVRPVVVRGHPLGSSSRRATQGETVLHLDPGEALCLYSDGLPETLIGPGKQLGYDALENALPGLIGPDAMATERGIRAWHARVAPISGPPDDDVTVVILQRLRS